MKLNLQNKQTLIAYLESGNIHLYAYMALSCFYENYNLWKISFYCTRNAP
jgi:hypothetical protein